MHNLLLIYRDTMQALRIQNEWMIDAWNYFHSIKDPDHFDIQSLIDLMKGREIRDKRANLIISRIMNDRYCRYHTWLYYIIIHCNIIPSDVELIMKCIDTEDGVEIGMFYALHHTHTFRECLTDERFLNLIKRTTENWKDICLQINTMPMYLFFNRYYNNKHTKQSDADTTPEIVMTYLCSNQFPDDLYTELMFLMDVL